MMIIPLTILALLQLRLGSGNWVNRSLGGEDISGFSAGGHLRVSSTFSFVAQFAMYLNAMVFMLGAFLYVRPGKAKMSVYLAMTVCGCFILSSFATGSRTAVLGDGTILGLAGALLLLKGNGKASASFFGTILVGAVAYFGVKYYWPEAFEAYEARSSGTGANSQDIEIEGRMSNALLGWMDGIGGAPPSNFGYGLGVMSNGSGLISPYAARWRANVGWGETDLANTLFEGGYYLVCVWMAFRLFIVAFVLQRVWALRDPQLVTAGCLAAGFVVVEGTMGALGIQPPLAIWFWLAVGTVLALEQLDRRPEPELSPGETNIDGPKAARQKSGARAGFG
jgi:hypothetical protein